MPQQEGRLTERVHYCGDVLKFTLDAIELGIAAFAPTASIHHDHVEVRGEIREKGNPAGGRATRAVNQNQRRAFAFAQGGNRRAVLRNDRTHLADSRCDYMVETESASDYTDDLWRTASLLDQKGNYSLPPGRQLTR